MSRPSKLTPDIKIRIGENIALGLTYSLAAESAGVTYKTFNLWLKKGENSTAGKYYQFHKYIEKYNADAAKALFELLNSAAKAGDTRICLWILEHRFSEDFGRREYRKQMLYQNVELIVNDADGIRKQILDKLV